MKMLVAPVIAVVAVLLVQTYWHDCHWLGAYQWKQWATCLLAVQG